MDHCIGSKPGVRLAIALGALGATCSAPALAATHRVVVSVGHNTGADDRAPLRYAEEDAGKFADVMIDLGDVDPNSVFLLQGKGSSAVHAALDQATAAVARVRKNPDDRAVLIFFYSGHSDGQTIELARERLAYSELRAWLAKTGADVRIAIIDSCKSGALIQNKGGARGPAFSITMADELASAGEVFLTSAAADEDALESAEVRGSFFTHHFVSGLRGAADASGDGAVTLSEAYEYAFNHTVASTAETGGAPQHPTYDYRVAGRGELRLTELSRRSAMLEIGSEFQRALVIHPRRDQVIAELTAPATRRVAVAPGDYSVRLWRDGHQRFGRVKVGAGQTASITWDQLTPLDAPAPPARKGGRTDEPTITEPALPAAQQAEWDRSSLTIDERGDLYLGKHQHRIDQRAAFEVMKRGDLVVAHDRKRATRYEMIGGGIGIAVAAIIIDRLVVQDCIDTAFGNPRDPSCISNASTVNSLAGIAVLGGVALAIVGIVRDTDVVSGRELHTLVDEYNHALRARLLDAPPPASGAPVSERRSIAPTAPVTALRLSVWTRPGDPGSAGLAVAARF